MRETFPGKVHSFVRRRKDEDGAGKQLLYRRSFDEYCQSIRSADESKRGGSKKDTEEHIADSVQESPAQRIQDDETWEELPLLAADDDVGG